MNHKIFFPGIKIEQITKAKAPTTADQRDVVTKGKTQSATPRAIAAHLGVLKTGKHAISNTEFMDSGLAVSTKDSETPAIRNKPATRVPRVTSSTKKDRPLPNLSKSKFLTAKNVKTKRI